MYYTAIKALLFLLMNKMFIRRNSCGITWKGMRFYSSEAIFQGEKTGRRETLEYSSFCPQEKQNKKERLYP